MTFISEKPKNILSMLGDSKKSIIKLILVGSSGVGKTSLVSTYMKNPFEEQVSVPTVAPASTAANVVLDTGENVQLQIWDTAGQERFQSISQMFYRGAHVAFVCYDLENKETIGAWVERVRAEVPECIIFLIATKIDKLSEEALFALQTDGFELVQTYKAAMHILTSSLNHTGIDAAFMEAAKCAKKIYHSNEAVVELSNSNNNKDSCC